MALADVLVELMVIDVPELIGEIVTVYESIDSPPLESGAVIAIVAVVVSPVATEADAAAGAVGAEYVTPSETVVEAVFETPAISTVAVIVYAVATVKAVGVPEIVPVAVSKLSPAGRVPLSAYVAVLPASAARLVVIGVIAVFTAPIALATDVEIAGLVVKVDVVTELPVPAEFVAVTDAEY